MSVASLARQLGNTTVRVLLIEDHAIEARLIRLMLESVPGLSVDVTEAHDLAGGVAALATASPAAPPFDVLLLDLGLPECVGLETVRRLYARCPRVPALVVLSSLSDEEVALQALQEGATDYLVKGKVDPAQLARALRYAIGRNQAADALRAARDRAEVANHAKSAFLANMSHDLRTPLNGILGFAQLLQVDPRLDARQRDALGTIRGCGEHLLTMIDDLLDLSKIEAGKFEIRPGPLAVAQFLQDVLEIVRVKAERKGGVRLEARLAADLPATVKADEQRLRQVVLNLLDNAVKFTDDGTVTLVVERDAERPGSLRVQVRDEGVGMSADELSRLFQPFEQVGTARSRAGGTGLGLAISRQLVRLMGGELDVTSAPGSGSNFHFTLPAPELDLAPPPPARPLEGLPHLDGPADRPALVVDDILSNRAVAADALSHAGFEVLEASTGREALEVLAAQPPGLVVLDLTLPEVHGLDVLRRLREADLHVPVIAVSASATGDTRDAALAAGADEFLAKPLDVRTLLESAIRLASRTHA